MLHQITNLSSWIAVQKIQLLCKKKLQKIDKEVVVGFSDLAQRLKPYLFLLQPTPKSVVSNLVR